MKLFNKVAIIGVGLIGGSLGLALKKGRLCKKVIGIFRRKKSLRKALEKKAVDEGYLETDAIKDADLIILATPIRMILRQLKEVIKIAKKGAIVIDVGSTKLEIIKRVKSLEYKKLHFIGCHPLAGLEKRGVENADAGLFENSICIITPIGKIDNRIKLMWKKLGAKVKIMTPTAHDKIVSFTSHMPHALAFSLILSIPPHILRISGNSLKDTTRIVSSDASIWADIFLTNKNPTLCALDNFQSSLKRFRHALITRNEKKLIALIRKSQNLKGLIK